MTKASKKTKKPGVKPGKKPARDNGVTVEIVLGPYGTKAQAQAEELQFHHPNVFTYRSAIFPHPSNYQVTPTVVSSEVTTLKGKSVLYPYGLKLTIKVTGEKDRADDWVLSLKNRARQWIVEQ